MRGDKIVKFFMPKEERFHELLERDTEHLVRAARLFSEVANSESLEDRRAKVAQLRHLLSSARLFLEIAKSTSLDDRRVKVAQLKALEHDGDLITRDIFNALNSTFITPLDREDIRTIATDLDDILDYMEGVAQYLILFEIKDSPEPLRKFAEILVAMVEEVHTATGMVWDLSNEKKIQEAIVRISVLENEADAVYFGVIADLFKEGSGKTPVEILKWKEIYQGLEDACDECKEFTHVLGNIVVKNA